MTTVYQRVGPFEILSEVGRGGMGVVFLAVDSRSGARVALKLVRIENDREGSEALEAERWGAILHEHFSKVCPQVPAVYEYDVEPEGQYFYIAMEYIQGQNLSEVIAFDPLQPDRAVGIAVELCRVLERAHAFELTIRERQFRCLIHGDLKPRNVRLTRENELKVLDFGIAKALSLSRKVIRNDFGSMAYLSPERLETGEVNVHSDLWAVGVLLYEMLSGEQPFRGADTKRLHDRITSRRPPASLAARCPAALEAILARLFAPQPSDRYPDASAIREDLQRFAAGGSTVAAGRGLPIEPPDEPPTRRTRPAADDGPTRRTPKAAVPPPRPDTATRPPRPSRRWRPRSVRGAFRAALVLIAFLTVWNEACVATDAMRLAAAVRGRELNGLGEMWTGYDRLAQRSRLGFGLVPLERSLTTRTKLLASRVMDRYRSAGVVVREREWATAREALSRATAVAPRDPELQAAQRYCDGHVYRINGEARKMRRQTDDARQHFSHAVTAFREAAELRPDWPDPFLGLARTFISGLDDLDRGADALKQAQRRGYTTGEREALQLAEGYRRRGESLARTARKLEGVPQEQEYLSRSADAYRQALSLYGGLITFDAAESIRLTQRGLKRVTDRLEELSAAAAAEIAAVPEDDHDPEVPEWR